MKRIIWVMCTYSLNSWNALILMKVSQNLHITILRVHLVCNFNLCHGNAVYDWALSMNKFSLKIEGVEDIYALNFHQKEKEKKKWTIQFGLVYLLHRMPKLFHSANQKLFVKEVNRRIAVTPSPFCHSPTFFVF